MKTMKTSQLKLLLGVMCAAGALEMASPASGATMTYDYTSTGGLGGLTGGAWTLMKYTPTTATVTWEDTFNYTNNGTSVGFTRNNLPPASSSSGYRGALVWTAPANEVVTQIQIHYWSSTGANDFVPVVYELAHSETLNATTDVLTTLSVGSYTTTFPYTVMANVQGIGLGFDTKGIAYNGWYIYDGSVIITTTTIPEPVTAGLLLLGGACLACVRRRRGAGA